MFANKETKQQIEDLKRWQQSVYPDIYNARKQLEALLEYLGVEVVYGAMVPPRVIIVPKPEAKGPGE